ncbi:(d)CMP kinase [Buchananella hordeovulneris]|uniref:(d)CMP kinase n=1 Tax=Buchananella hordeovulneris TaxID=52770 RepID=UPI0026DB7756|nr:(d)CMP kinase [Buchananella hordeovulneris]MDO5079728.1 (d)CMP kinase [Buchananella hordeovulneris]
MAGPLVAIDGPSGSGKSTAARGLARYLGAQYLDTGAMYRAAAWWCQRQGIALDDAAAVAAAVAELPLVMGTDPAAPRVTCAGQDVTEIIRSPAISTVVSQVATNLEVRRLLRLRQQELIAAAVTSGEGIVAEGRDITTVVAPSAPVRILLVASAQARLERRALQDLGAAGRAEQEQVRDAVVRRDADDSTVSNFTTAADGVIELDNSTFAPAETLAAIIEITVATYPHFADRQPRRT